MDYFIEGKAHGPVAHRLLANGMNVNALRTNDTLLYDEWKQIDNAVVKAALRRAVGVADLQAAGLTYGGFNGMAKTVLGYQDASDISDANMNMDGVNEGDRDRMEFDIHYLPLPIIHKDFSFSIREINESRNGSMPLDTSMAEMAATKVIEKVESIIFAGASSYKFGGGTLYGLSDYTNVNSVSLSTNWDASAKTGADIVDDVRSMKQASINDRFFGPWNLYVPTAYETVLDDDYASGYPKTIRQRILEIDGIQSVKVSDFLAANTVILVQMTPDVIRLVEGLPITTVQWDTEGGMKVRFKVMAIMVPQIRAAQDGKCGVVKLA